MPTKVITLEIVTTCPKAAAMAGVADRRQMGFLSFHMTHMSLLPVSFSLFLTVPRTHFTCVLRKG